MKTQSLEQVSKKYLNDTVKSFSSATSHIQEFIENEHPVIKRMAYLQKRVKEDVITEDHVKDFCETINHAADNGWIEKAALCPVSSMELAKEFMGKPIGGHILFFFAFSRFTLEELKEKSSSFVAEGELIN